MVTSPLTRSSTTSTCSSESSVTSPAGTPDREVHGLALGEVVPGLDTLVRLRVGEGALYAEVGQGARVHQAARDRDLVGVAAGQGQVRPERSRA